MSCSVCKGELYGPCPAGCQPTRLEDRVTAEAFTSARAKSTVFTSQAPAAPAGGFVFREATHCNGCGCRTGDEVDMHQSWCPVVLDIRARDFEAKIQGILAAGLEQIAQAQAKPNTSEPDDFARGARFGDVHARGVLGPLVDAAEHGLAKGEQLALAKALQVVDRVLDQVAKAGGPAHFDVLRQVREGIAAELGIGLRGCVVGGSEG